ncbi:MAG: PP2C family protein-serine/threonine phosphatase [Chloroherpetonaceae bacterium]|nr:PP2C family protein-serine/threonine phosphatase [Chloroherpetonaceae bacterium]
MNSTNPFNSQLLSVLKTLTLKDWAILIFQFIGSLFAGFVIFFLSIFFLSQVLINESSPRYQEMLKKSAGYILKQKSSYSSSLSQDSTAYKQALVGFQMGIKMAYFNEQYLQKWMIYAFLFIFSFTITGSLFYQKFFSKTAINDNEESIFRTVISHLILFGVGIFTKRSAEQFSLFYNLTTRTRLIAFAAYFFIFGSVYANAFSNKWIAGIQSTDLFIILSILDYGGLLLLIGFVLFFQPLRRYGTMILRVASLLIFLITLVITFFNSTESLQFALQANQNSTSDFSFGYQSLSTFLLVCGVSCYLQVARRVIIEKQKMEGELTLARKVQEKLLPQVSIETDTFSAFGNTICASEVGGDYFDFVPISHEGKLRAIAVGDVSGHNMAAGVLMAIVKSAFRSEIRHRDYQRPESISKLTAALNETVADLREKQMFVSFSAIIIDSASGLLHYANAGHLPILHYKSNQNTINEVYQKTPALGLLREIPFPHLSIPFETGDYFFLFTDGLTEVSTSKGEEFGIERLRQTIFDALQHSEPSPKVIYQRLVSSAEAFSSKQGFSDDVTLFIIKV